MRTGILLLLLLFLTLQTDSRGGEPARLGKRLRAWYQNTESGGFAVILIYLKDKGPRGDAGLYSAGELLSARSIARRGRVRTQDSLIDGQDLPVENSYVGRISGMVLRVRHTLKWFNAVS
ncbi:MAG TPA: hypothetical protein VJO14_06835, partial [Bacteroidota bacterium]|nr:hypothetical protein [Bacteroidota bacterium]